MTGYIIRLDGIEYSGYRDGRPFTLADAWRETEGLRNCEILSPTGRVVLANAGSMTVRHYELPRDVRCRRQEARRLRAAGDIRTCPTCHVRCWRIGSLWHHPETSGCSLEYWHVNHEPLTGSPCTTIPDYVFTN